MQNSDCGIRNSRAGQSGAEPSAALRIQVANQQSSLTVDEAKLQAAVRSVLEDSPYKTASVSVALVDDPTIHELNRKHLQHDYPTDILSFFLSDDDSHLEGELIASADTAISNAAEYGWPATDELLLYMIHGALHLVGYRDKDSEDRSAMVAAEATHLKKLGIVLPRDQSRWQPAAPPTETQGEVPTS